MLATSPNTVLAPAEEESAPTLVSDAPTQSSLMDFENKLKEAEQRKTTVPARNDLLARVQAAQQRSRLAQEKQKQEQLMKMKAAKEEENILAEKLEETQIAPKDPPPVENDTANALGDFFDSPAPVVANTPTQTPPSAPPAVEETTNYSNVNPVPPPAPVAGEAPPSFEQFEARLKSNEIDDEVFNLDADGNTLTPQQRQEMLLEQERILKQIEEEKIANDRAIAELTAEENYPQQHPQSIQEPETSTGVAQGNVASAAPPGNVRTIEIAPNKRVALHGQDRTKEAIKKGTAVLVQCLNCQNWMQVTPTATLMFCPVCQVVSPVEHQSSVMTKDEAMQLSLDRLLAEKMQKEEYAAARGGDQNEEEEGLFSSFKASVFGSSSNAATGVLSEEHRGLTGNSSRNSAKKQSWTEFLASYVPGASTEEDYANKPRSAEIVVGRKSHPRQRSTASIYGGDSEEEVTFSRGNNEEQSSLLRPALVAESKPLFSCMVDSVSTMLTGQSSVPDGKLHGVDTSSLLSVSGAGRKQDDGRGDYQKI